MKSFLAAICIFISVATFLKKEEAKRVDAIQTSYSIDGQKYDIHHLPNEAMINVFFEQMSNLEEATEETNAFVLVKNQNTVNRDGGYFVVPLEKQESVQQFIKMHAEPIQLEKTPSSLNKETTIEDDSPLALQML